MHQNEIQNAYFGNSIFSIFITCCYTKSLIDNGDGLKKESVVVISESKDHNQIAALTCLKKVIEEVERVNAVKYTKVVVWSDGCAAQFRYRFVFRLPTDCFFEGIKLSLFYNEKSYGKGSMDGVAWTVENVVFRKVKSGFLTIDSPFEFYQAVKNYVPAIKCVYVSNEDIFEEPENMEQESIPIRETLKSHKIERSEMKGIYGLKYFYLAEDEKPFFMQWYANGKDVLICGHDDKKVDTNHCAACSVEYDKAEEWIQ